MSVAREAGDDALLAWRSEFPILERTTYLVSNSLGAMPRTVPARMAEYTARWAEEGVRAWGNGWWEMPVRVGDEIAPLLGADAGEVAMVPNVTAAQALILSAIDFRAGRDTIVMTELDFPSVRYVTDALGRGGRAGVGQGLVGDAGAGRRRDRPTARCRSWRGGDGA